MSQIIILTDKRGRSYAYRNFNYWDKEKKAPRTRREYLGRVDSDGNIIPKKGRKSDSASADAPANKSVASNSTDCSEVYRRLDRIEKQVDNLTKVVRSLAQGLGGLSAQNEQAVNQFTVLHAI